MFAEIMSLAVEGIGGYKVSVEVNISQGLPSFDIVGLPDASVKESRERVRAAIKNNGFKFPVSRLTVNLAPADKKKIGTIYDLPVLVGILAATECIKKPMSDSAFVGELSLTGELRPIPGVLPMALACEENGIKKLYVPCENADEAAFTQGVEVYPIRNVSELVRCLNNEKEIVPAGFSGFGTFTEDVLDFADVKGQENVKRAMEIAAAGGHNILIIGPPGSGKSMMAKRLPTILPEMSRDEMVSSTGIYSVAGLTSKDSPVIFQRPFRSPHHTISAAGLAGGGTIPKPGEISLAHNGVLFLDELPEFRSDVLEVLRQPLEDGEVTVSRVSGSVTFPSRFMLVCAMNPCKCGWYGHYSGRCKCTSSEIHRYQSRVSGPLLDRIDLLVKVPALEYNELKDTKLSEGSAEIKRRVDAARQVQRKRYGDSSLCNAYMGPKELREYCKLSPACELLMKRAFDAMGLSARSYDKILRIARTIADLSGEKDIGPSHIGEAIQYRTNDFREN